MLGNIKKRESENAELERESDLAEGIPRGVVGGKPVIRRSFFNFTT